MKRLIFLFSLLVALGAAINAQQYLYFPADDTITADTNYIPSSSGYALKNIESGVLSFTFTTSDVTDSLSFAGLEWRNNTDDAWTAYTGNGILSETSTDGIHKVYISTPLIDRFVRVRLSCATGDEVAITNQTMMLKED